MRTIAGEGGGNPRPLLQETLSEWRMKMIADGFRDIFSITPRGLYSMNTSRYYRPEQVQRDRCELVPAKTSGSEAVVIHVIETTDGVKGLLLDQSNGENAAELDAFFREAEAFRRQMNAYGPNAC